MSCEQVAGGSDRCCGGWSAGWRRLRMLGVVVGVAVAVLGWWTRAQGADGAEARAWTLEEMGYSVRLWTVEDGLPADFVDRLAQTPDGYIWWPTPWGVVRFDGIRLRSFRLVPSVARSPIQGVFCDSLGRLWVWDLEGLVGRFEGDVFLPQKSAGPGVSMGCGLLEGPEGQVWLGRDHPLGHGFLERVDAVGAEPERLMLPDVSLAHRKAIMDSAMGVWVWQFGKVWEARPDGPKLAPLRNANGVEERNVSFFFRLPNGRSAVAGRFGVYELEGTEWRLARPWKFPGERNLNLQAAAADGLGKVWMGTRGSGLWVALADGPVGRVELPGLVLPDGFGIGAVYVDRENNVWVGSRRGLYQIQSVLFRRMLKSDWLDRSEPTDLAEDAEGNFWVVMENGGVVRYGVEDGAARPIEGLGLGPIAVESSDDGTVWLASNKEVWEWRHDRLRSLGGLGAEIRIYDLHEAGGTLWVSSDLGLRRWDGSRFEEEPLFPQASDGGIPRVAANARGTLRAYQDGLGMLEYVDGAWRLMSHLTRPPSRVVLSLHVDPESRVWLCGSDPALIRQDGTDWVEVPLGKLEMPAEVLDICSDDQGGLWGLTAAQGLFRVERDVDPNDSTSAQWFGTAAGLPSNAGRGWGKGLIKSADGRVWAATAKGVAAIDPIEWKAKRRDLGPPQVHIEQVLQDDVPVQTLDSGRLVVPRTASRLEFQFTAIGLNHAEANRFRYQMAGLDRSPVEAGTERSAVYNKVPPGTYEFHVTAANNFGVWNEEGARLAVTITPVWWERRPVQVAGALGLVLLALVAHKRRSAQLKREHHLQRTFSNQLIQSQEEERKRIAQELHDGLGQSLLVIKNSLRFALRKHAPQPDLCRHLNEVSEQAAHAMEEIRSLTTDLRPPDLDRFGLVEATRAMVQRVQETVGFEIVCRLDPLDREWLPEQEIQLYRIIQESINNAIKHASAEHVWIEASETEGCSFLDIRDDGQGFDPLTVQGRPGGSSGLGLTGLRQRAEFLGGSMSLTTAPGKGVLLQFRIPHQTAGS